MLAKTVSDCVLCIDDVLLLETVRGGGYNCNLPLYSENCGRRCVQSLLSPLSLRYESEFPVLQCFWPLLGPLFWPLFQILFMPTMGKIIDLAEAFNTLTWGICT
uniref:Uncharacterized protein n=1 Tax=Rhizophora mucronata TaxID=61149 RepID=A0A2P2JWZ0_RHIMU